jgi:hypothetical protein
MLAKVAISPHGRGSFIVAPATVVFVWPETFLLDFVRERVVMAGEPVWDNIAETAAMAQ